MQGRASDDPQRSYAGNRPSATILLERLDARSLGALIAFYEHRTFANAVLLGINPFDQFGVELGKDIARQLGEGADDADARPVDPRADRKGGRLMADFDLFVIGAGSGGVRAARVAAAHGAKVAIAEEHQGRRDLRDPRLRAQEAARLRRAFCRGHRTTRRCSAGTCPASASTGRCCATMCWPRSARLEAAYTDTLTNHDVRSSTSAPCSPGPIRSRWRAGKTVTAGKILIATGARPLMPEIDGIEHAISSNEVFHLESLPKRIVIAGGGYIANEFAGIFHQFGSQVTLVNRTDTMLRHYDQQIVDRLIQISLAQGHRLRVQRDHRVDRAAATTGRSS